MSHRKIRFSTISWAVSLHKSEKALISGRHYLKAGLEALFTCPLNEMVMLLGVLLVKTKPKFLAAETFRQCHLSFFSVAEVKIKPSLMFEGKDRDLP